jgi:hypothetical protein
VARQPVCQQAIAAVLEVYGVGGAKADQSGNARISAVPAGTYYLHGLAVFNAHPILWNLRVELKAGENSVTLDPRNATPIQ